MEYLVILNVIYDNGEKDKTSIYKLESEVEAISNFHKYLGQYIGADNVQTVLCMAVNSVGGIYKNESWSAPKEMEELPENE